jgi:very-short-patch-repair endonuclease
MTRPAPIHTRTTSELWEKIKPLARQMRRAPTPVEEALWRRLCRKQLRDVRFRRQHPIDRFIADFYCAEARLVVEVDGAIHEYTLEEDALRQAFLESMGLRVVRFSNDAVLQDIEAVLERIGEAIQP